jgi:hypothetical protein
MKILRLGVTQHFTDKVYWVLDLVIGIRLPPLNDDSYTDHITRSWYVKMQVLMGFQAYQSRWGGQILLQVFEGLLCLLGTPELVSFFEELKKWESPDVESQNESAQGSHTSHQLLYIMEALGWLHLGDSRHLLWVRVNTCHTWFLYQNHVLIICMTQYQLFHTYHQKCSQITNVMNNVWLLLHK